MFSLFGLAHNPTHRDYQAAVYEVTSKQAYDIQTSQNYAFRFYHGFNIGGTTSYDYQLGGTMESMDCPMSKAIYGHFSDLFQAKDSNMRKHTVCATPKNPKKNTRKNRRYSSN